MKNNDIAHKPGTSAITPIMVAITLLLATVAPALPWVAFMVAVTTVIMAVEENNTVIMWQKVVLFTVVTIALAITQHKFGYEWALLLYVFVHVNLQGVMEW